MKLSLRISYVLFICLFVFQGKAEYLASGYRKGSIKIWDIDKIPGKELVRTLELVKSNVETIAFNPFHPNILVSGSYAKTDMIFGDTIKKLDGKIKIWDLNKKPGEELIRTLDAHTDRVYSVVYSPFHPNVLASGSLDGKIKIWDLNKKPGQELVKTLDGEGGSVYMVKFSPFYENILASASTDGVIKIWDISKKEYQELINTLSDNKGVTFSVAFSQFNKDLLAAGSRSNLNIWNISKKRKGKGLIRSFSGSVAYNKANSLAFNLLSTNILAAGGREGITIYDLTKQRQMDSQTSINMPGACLAFSFVDKNILAAGSGSYRFNVIRILDTSKNYRKWQSGDQNEKFLVKVLKGTYGDTIQCLAFQPPKKSIALKIGLKKELKKRTKQFGDIIIKTQSISLLDEVKDAFKKLIMKYKNGTASKEETEFLKSLKNIEL